ncbi:Rv1733c family protein [Actinacidiphila alni]|uniref:Uncharacterized protein n=1 Tax=Actinacidiphila alni TaxID=380248 RepID=A0A1I2JPH1_9ACTN|nr:hypothetical protein [Actinacidiphila alni]SFF56712.1 hypothetical protein SAMN05216251_11970 [Actinacidiphila alni]
MGRRSRPPGRGSRAERPGRRRDRHGRAERLGRYGWRWRRNPLRRRSDLVEAWLGLFTAVLLCATPLLGWWAGHSVDRALQRVVRTENAQRKLVRAEVLDPPEGGVKVADKVGTADPRRGDLLRWTSRDHKSVYTAPVSPDIEVWRDGRIWLWADRAGELVPPPLDAATATTHAVLAGTTAGSASAGFVFLTRQLLMWRLMRRRLAGWEKDWARVGQDWGRAGAGG